MLVNHICRPKCMFSRTCLKARDVDRIPEKILTCDQVKAYLQENNITILPQTAKDRERERMCMQMYEYNRRASMLQHL